MPHIHTGTGQHDMTVSAYVVREVDGQWLCLLHMHRKIDRLMQVGGHIELTQTPWQAVAAELREEAGYELAELELLQLLATVPHFTDAVIHPLPLLQNTHDVGGGHYHSDQCYGFVAHAASGTNPDAGESADLRWCSLGELRELAVSGEALQDVVDIYEYILENLQHYTRVDPMRFSLQKPVKGITYKR